MARASRNGRSLVGARLLVISPPPKHKFLKKFETPFFVARLAQQPQQVQNEQKAQGSQITFI